MTGEMVPDIGTRELVPVGKPLTCSMCGKPTKVCAACEAASQGWDPVNCPDTVCSRCYGTVRG